MTSRIYAGIRYLILFALLPVTLIVYTTTPANAGTIYGSNGVAGGPPVPFSFSTPATSAGGVDRSTVRCNGTAVYEVPSTLQLHLLGSIVCKVDVAYTGDPGPGDLTGFQTTIWVEGATPDGNVETCEGEDSLTGDPLVSQEWRTGALGGGCTITNYCVSGDWTQAQPMTGDGQWSFEYCSTLGVGAPPNAEASCALGMPARTVLNSPYDPSSGNYAHYVEMHFTAGNLEGAAGGQIWKHWRFDVREPTGGGGVVPDLAKTTWRAGPTTTTSGEAWEGSKWRTRQSFGAGNGYTSAGNPLGIWVWAVATDNASAWPGSVRAHNTYTYGDNDPGNCHFYFGPKFRDDPNSKLDDPHGMPNTDDIPDTSTPPDTTPEPLPDAPAADCEFTLSDPSSWASAGICALVGLVGILIDIIGDVLGVLRGLADAFRDMIKGLFIPSDGFLERKINDLKDAFEGSTLGNYLDALELPATSAGGCQGPAFPAINAYGMSSPESYPMSACAGGMATLASTARLILTVSVTLAGALACVRILGRGIGWDPGFGGDR